MTKGLKEILNSRDLILIDGSTQSGGKGLCWEMYDVNRYSQLNTDEIIDAISDIQELEYILSCANTYTISNVTAEIKEFERILGDKIRGLLPRQIPKTPKIREKRKKRDQKAKELLCNLQKKVYNIRRLAESSEINKFPEFKEINNSTYNSLLNMMKLIDGQIGLKRDFGFLKGEHKTDRSKDSDTDEKLVATLYQLSLFNRSSCLLSQDTDFIRLLKVGTGLIGSDSFLPYNEKFRDKIIQNPFELYFREIKENEYKLKVQSSRMRYEDKFRIKNATPERSDWIKGEITKMWEKFS